MSDRSDKTAHVDGFLRELLAGTIEDAEAEPAWTHLSECRECAESLRLARTLYDAGLSEGTAHIYPEKMVAYAEGRVALSHAEQAHLARCTSCRAEADLLADLPDASTIPLEIPSVEQRSPRAGSRTMRSLFRWRLGGAVALAAAAVWAAFVLVPPRAVDTRGLADLAPIEVRIPRSAPDPGSFEDLWIEALGHYAAGSYPEAERGFRRVLDADPDHAESWLLLGSSLLLQGQASPASAAFHMAGLHAEGDRAREEAEWQGCLAALSGETTSLDDLDRIQLRLETLVEAEGTHAAEAANLLSRVRERRAGR